MSAESERCVKCDWKPTIGDSVLSRHMELSHRSEREELAQALEAEMRKGAPIKDFMGRVTGVLGGPTFEDLADAILAAGFTRQSRAEIQAEAVEAAVARVESLYKGSVRDLQERAQDPRASKVHKARGFGRMDALATALSDLRDYAQRIREGAES